MTREGGRVSFPLIGAVGARPKINITNVDIAAGRIRPATLGRAGLLADVRERLKSGVIDNDNCGTAALEQLREAERY